MGKNRLLDRLGYVRVYHKDTGEKRTYPISPKIYNNKEKMAQLGYYEVDKPSEPVVIKEKIADQQATEELINEFKTSTPPKSNRGRPKTKKDGN